MEVMCALDHPAPPFYTLYVRTIDSGDTSLYNGYSLGPKLLNGVTHHGFKLILLSTHSVHVYLSGACTLN